jgi:hypothetical protein
VQVTKHYKPDTKAAIRWLESRQRALWGKQKEITVNNKQKLVLANVDISGLSTEELLLFEKVGLAKRVEEKNIEDVEAEEI